MKKSNFYTQIIPDKLLQITYTCSNPKPIQEIFDDILGNYDIIDMQIETMKFNHNNLSQTFIISALVSVIPKTSDMKIKVVMNDFQKEFTKSLISACNDITSKNAKIIDVKHKIAHNELKNTFCYFAFIVYI